MSYRDPDSGLEFPSYDAYVEARMGEQREAEYWREQEREYREEQEAEFWQSKLEAGDEPPPQRLWDPDECVCHRGPEWAHVCSADHGRAGEPARVRPDGWELIGTDECPLMLRRTLFASRWGKLLVHRFFPGASDGAAHDHPRSFVTVVLRGGYEDRSLCPRCHGTAKLPPSGGFEIGCLRPGCEDGWVVDRVAAPAVRFRRAEHAHVTRVFPEGATTVVLMGPLRRDWGFWREGRWYPWRVFERVFGTDWRCP